MLKNAGITVIHKVPAIKYALKAQEIGVDAVSIVGAECGGHPGEEMIGSFVNSILGLKRLNIPYFIGGGVGHGSQIVAALAMGASGVVIGTRFLVAEEIWAHNTYKQTLIDATESDTALIMSSIRNTVRALKNKTTDKVQEIEAGKNAVTLETLYPYINGQIGRETYQNGSVAHGVLSAGQALGVVEKVEPISSIISNLEAEIELSISRISK